MLNELIEKDLEIQSLDNLLKRLTDKLEEVFHEDNFSLAFVGNGVDIPTIGMYMNVLRATEIMDLVTEVREAAKRHKEAE